MSSGIEFEEDKFNYSSKPQPNVSQPFSGQMSSVESAGMAGWLVRKGWAKSPQSAQIIMIGLVIVNIIVTILVVLYFI